MGWTAFSHRGKSTLDCIKKDLGNDFSRVEAVSNSGSVYYLAIKTGEDVSAVVVLTRRTPMKEIHLKYKEKKD